MLTSRLAGVSLLIIIRYVTNGVSGDDGVPASASGTLIISYRAMECVISHLMVPEGSVCSLFVHSIVLEVVISYLAHVGIFCWCHLVQMLAYDSFYPLSKFIKNC